MKGRRLQVSVGAVVLVLIMSILVLIYNPQTTSAISTVGTSSVAAATSSIAQRTTVEASDATTVTIYQSGTESPNGLSFRTSTDNTATWSSATQIDTSTSTDFSSVIDADNNIYVAWVDSGTTKIRKLTYSAGSWTVGSANTVKSAVTCSVGATDGIAYSRVVVAITSELKVWVSALRQTITQSACSTSIYVEHTTSSTDLSSWTDNAATIASGSLTYTSTVALGSGIWMVTGGYIYADSLGSGVLTRLNSTNLVATSPISMAYGNDEMLFFYKSGSTLLFRKYTVSTNTLSSTTTISSVSNDVAGSISSDSYNHWVFYQSYVAANSYNVVYKRYNGSSWDGSATAVTTDNANNTLINAPARIPNTISSPIVWNVGTASPYTVKSESVSNVGTATDSGNVGGSYSGSLTGSSGDQIVKSGEWYYSSINVVNGMTIRVLAFDGVTGGALIIHGGTVTVDGTIDGNGRGNPSGYVLPAVGGAGGGGGGGDNPCTATAGSGSNGQDGMSFNGGSGYGSYAGGGGTGGASASGGGTGATGTASSGGAPGTGGSGAGVTAGTSGTNGGYLSAGSNGDSSTDQTLSMGSAGGAGGTGGAGAGGGGGAGGGDGALGNPEKVGGGGGAGGAGGAGAGGAGGAGGAIVKIYSTSTATISGSITVAGGNAGSGGAAMAGVNGGSGTSGTGTGTCL